MIVDACSSWVGVCFWLWVGVGRPPVRGRCPFVQTVWSLYRWLQCLIVGPLLYWTRLIPWSTICGGSQLRGWDQNRSIKAERNSARWKGRSLPVIRLRAPPQWNASPSLLGFVFHIPSPGAEEISPKLVHISAETFCASRTCHLDLGSHDWLHLFWDLRKR